MRIESYPFYCRNEEIGRFVEKHTDFGVELEMHMKPGLDYDNFDIIDLKPWVENDVINDKGVRFWMDNRCYPRNRQGLEWYLSIMGLSEYNQLAIMHKTFAINMDDFYSIGFKEDYSFDKNHPKSPNFEYFYGKKGQNCGWKITDESNFAPIVVPESEIIERWLPREVAEGTSSWDYMIKYV